MRITEDRKRNTAISLNENTGLKISLTARKLQNLLANPQVFQPLSKD